METTSEPDNRSSRDRIHRSPLHQAPLRQVHRSISLEPPQGLALNQERGTQEHSKGSDAVMTATIPVVAVAGFAVYVAYRLGMRVWHAIVCAIFGFLLGATPAAPQITHLLMTITQWLQRP
jgi:hypothetical protein